MDLWNRLEVGKYLVGALASVAVVAGLVAPGVFSQCEVAIFEPDMGMDGDQFGRSSVRGDVAVVGARNANQAFVYQFEGGEWGDPTELIPDDLPADGDQYGISVAVDGDVVLVGAYGDTDSTGAVYVFRFFDSTGLPGTTRRH